MNRCKGRARRIAAFAVVGLVPLLTTWVGNTLAQTSPQIIPFQASAAASGVLATLTLPGAPLSDVLIDSGGPTAQVDGSSSSGTTGYAAFPSPGSLIESVPGLVTGLLSLGAAGLPPIELPPLPPYPFSVKSDTVTPDAVAGAGPYSIEAHTRGIESHSNASGGVQQSAGGAVALLESTADLEVTDRAVTVTATSNAEALTIGPLTIGGVRSTATMAVDAGGSVTSSYSIDVDGARVGALPISIEPDGLSLGGIPVPLELGSIVSKLLAGAGVTLEFQPAQKLEGRVVAPAVVITFPVEGAVLGASRGTMSVALGRATAAVVGASGIGSPAAPALTVPSGSGLATSGAGSGGGALPSPSPLGAVVPAPAVAPTVTQPVATAPLGFVDDFDLRLLYLVVVGGGLASWGFGQLLRVVGVKDRWTSTVG